jgi:hypothetical protein
MRYAKGIMWLDDCRIPFVDETEMDGVCKSDKTIKTYNEDWGNTIYNYKRTGGDTKGRFAPSLLVCDDMLNDGSVGVSSSKERKNKLPQNIYGSGKGIPPQTSKGFDDKGTNSRYYDLDKWFDKVIENL